MAIKHINPFLLHLFDAFSRCVNLKIIWLFVFLLTPFAFGVFPVHVVFAESSGKNSKIEPQIYEDMAAGKGTATFWVILKEKADISRAHQIKSHKERGEFVVNALKATANQSQAKFKGFLQSMGLKGTLVAPSRPFWIINAIPITGTEAFLNELAKNPQVEQVLADRVFAVPEPVVSNAVSSVNGVEWGIDRIGATQVWSDFNVRGEGIVVGSIDTGVQFDHPALVRQYRGNKGDGSFDHNYNWFDPSNVCGNPSLVPCDNHGHGTHVTGTMVGDDGDPGPNRIGVAPHAKWIAAKGCESGWCSFSALLGSGEWMLAPTDSNGQNPRTDLRPHIVNNSWGGGGGNPFFNAIVQAWVASGIFPVFANGNSGPSCNSVGFPANYQDSYGVGAFDINNAIATFSSRGASPFGGIIKPNIAAPGVAVRSSFLGNSYKTWAGTSMAAPHLAGSIALLWSIDPSLVGNIVDTRLLLDQTAIDTPDLTCGGTPANNNVWGEGRLDIYGTVFQAPKGPVGVLRGVVTNQNTELPINGASIRAVGNKTRRTNTNPQGEYTLTLPVGVYDVTASATGFVSKTEAATSTIMFNGIMATPVMWSGSVIVAAAPSGATTGPVTVTVGGKVSNGTIFTLIPKINVLSPFSGDEGRSVTIFGSGFGATQGNSTVTFNGLVATSTSWSDTTIAALAPVGVTTGPVIVTVGNQASNGVLFSVAPQIGNVSPSSGNVGASVTITGANFGATQGTSTITFNGITATPSSWNDTTIVVSVPTGATTGSVIVTVGALFSNGHNFRVIPKIDSLSPTTGSAGTMVTITGTGFGAAQGPSTVTFNGIATSHSTSWSTTAIQVLVPWGAATGQVIVTVDGQASNGVAFTVVPVKILFTSKRSANNSDIWEMNLDGTALAQLTTAPGEDVAVDISPDGQWILFVSDRDDTSGDNNDDIYLMRRDGSNVTRLTDHPANDTGPVFSPDGNQIVFGSDRVEQRSAIFIMNKDGTGLTQLTFGPSIATNQPSFSPDGNQIVYAFTSLDESQGTNFYIMNRDGSNPVIVPNASGDEPTFLPDNSGLVFVSSNEESYGHQIFRINRDGSGLVRLTTFATDGESYGPRLSRDGKKIFFDSKQTGKFEIYMMNPDGTGVVQLTNNPAINSYPIPVP